MDPSAVAEPVREDEEDVSTMITPDDASIEPEIQQQQKLAGRVRWKPKVVKTDDGMRGAFPGLDDYNTGGSSDEDEDSREAMRYLRQVR